MKPVRAVIAVVDLACALAVAIFTFLPVSLAALRHRWSDNEQGSILHISGSSSVRDVKEKFGSLDFLFNYDGDATAGVFTGNVLLWYPSRDSLYLRFENGWVVTEQKKIMGCLALTGAVIALFRLSRLVRREDVIAVRGWDPFFSGLAAWAVAGLYGLPWCVSVHADYRKREFLQGGVMPTIFGSPVMTERIEGFVCRRAGLLLPIRESMIPRLLGLGCAGEKIRLFPHGMNLEPTPDSRGREAPFLDMARGRKILSMVGRFERENYIYDYLAIAARLAAQREDWILIMAGHGGEVEKFRDHVQQRGLGEHVVACGFLSHEDALALRRISTVGLCLMAGFSLIEACAAGRPVIAYDVEWHRELVRDGETGYLVKEGDTDTAAARIAELLDSPAECAEMGRRARNLARERHSLENTAAVKRAVYRELLRRRTL